MKLMRWLMVCFIAADIESPDDEKRLVIVLIL